MCAWCTWRELDLEMVVDHMWMLGTEPGSLEEQEVLPASEPSPQPPSHLLFMFIYSLATPFQ